MSDESEDRGHEMGTSSSPTAPYGGAPVGSASGRADSLTSVIVRDIVPKLLIDHRSRSAKTKSAKRAFSARDELVFVTAVLSEPIEALRDRIDDHLLDGASGEQVLLELLTPVARRLGVLWETDTIDFFAVTIAVQNMQFLVRHVAERDGTGPVAGVRPAGKQRSAVLLVPAPAETHAFGLVVLGEILRRRGFDVHGGLPMPEAEMLKIVETQQFIAVGFSVSCETLLPGLARLIVRVRKTSGASGARIVVGGRLHSVVPDLAGRIGADVSFGDAQAAAEYLSDHAGDAAHQAN